MISGKNFKKKSENSTMQVLIRTASRITERPIFMNSKGAERRNSTRDTRHDNESLHLLCSILA
jgi:hypothetical protein